MGNIRGGMNGFLGTVGQPTAQVIDGSLKINSGSSQYLSRTPGSEGNRKTWTWSGWVKRDKYGTEDALFMSSDSGGNSDYTTLYFNTANELKTTSYQSSSRWRVTTNQLFRDIGWYHIVLAIDLTQGTNSNKVKLYVNGSQITSFRQEEYPSTNFETRINSTNEHSIGRGSLYNTWYADFGMSQVYFIDGQQLGPENFGFTDPLTNTWRPKKYKVPLAETVTVQPSYVSKSYVYDEANAFDGSSATEATYQSTGSWLSFTVDASNLTVPFEIRNDSSGTAQTVAMFTDSSGSSAAGGTWGSTGTNNLSPAISTTVEDTYTFPSAGTYYLRHTVGSDSNIFVYRIGGPVTTGANSFYLPMDNQDDFEKDKSGNGNDYTKVNFSGTSINPDVVKDSPSGAVFGGPPTSGITTTSSAPSNYPTLSPLININCTLSEGNLKFVTGGNNSTIWSTIPIPTSGKYCFESTFGGGDMALWLDQEARLVNRNPHTTSTALGMFMYYTTGSSNNRFQTNSVSTAMDSSFTTDTVGDVFMFEVDMNAGTVRVRKDDGSDSGLYTMPDALKAAPLFIGFSVTTTWPAVTQTLNFGQRPFKNTPPQGFLPLNSASARPNKVIARPDQYVGVTTYVGQDDILADSTIDTSTAYRYHRILFEGDSNGGSVSEIEFYDANGDKIDASDTNNAGNSVATNATQGLDGWTAFNGTRGGSSYSQGVRKDAGVGSAGFYISKDWGSGNTKIIYGVKVWGVNSYGLAGNTFNKYMKLQGSNNNSSWTDLQTWNSARFGSWTTSSSTDVGHISERHSEISVGHQPDLVFIKNRDSANQDGWFDSLRRSSEGSYFPIHTHSTDAHDSDGAAFTDLTEFTPNGFKLGNQYSSIVYDQNENHVAWTWKAGGNKNTFNVDDVGYATFAASGTTAGTITPTGTSIGTKQGFSIIKYAGTDTGSSQTIPHGLNKPPVFWIFKNISQAGDWIVYTTAIDGGSDYLKLNATDGANSGVSPWSTAPTNSVITVGTNNVDTCNDGDNYVMYAWHNVPGLQKFGKYIGNASSDGPFVETGMKPALVVFKKTSASGDAWLVYDATRDTHNLTAKRLFWNTNGSEQESNDYAIDIYSNGFKIRTSDGSWNASGATFIYMAWAEAPASNLFGGQSNAR